MRSYQLSVIGYQGESCSAPDFGSGIRSPVCWKRTQLPLVQSPSACCGWSFHIDSEARGGFCLSTVGGGGARLRWPSCRPGRRRRARPAGLRVYADREMRWSSQFLPSTITGAPGSADAFSPSRHLPDLYEMYAERICPAICLLKAPMVGPTPPERSLKGGRGPRRPFGSAGGASPDR